jgi:hypothetical protein
VHVGEYFRVGHHDICGPISLFFTMKNPYRGAISQLQVYTGFFSAYTHVHISDPTALVLRHLTYRSKHQW